MNKKIFLLLFFLFSIVRLRSQQDPLDSLYSVWANKNNADSVRIEALYNYAFDGYMSSEPDSALYFGELIYDLSKKINNIRGQAKGLKTIGYANYIKGNFTIALDYYQQSRDLFEKCKLKLGAVNMQFGIANIYKLQGDISKAIVAYTECLKKYEVLGDKLGQANSLSGISSIYQLEKDYPKAMETAEKSIKIFEEIGNENGMALQYNNLAGLYFLTEKFERAEELYKKSIQIYTGIGREDGVANVLGGLGNLYDHLKQHEKSFECQEKAYKIYEKIGDKQEMATCLNNLAYYNLDLNNNAKALDYARRAMIIGQMANVPLEVRDAALTMYEAFEKTGKLKEAIGMYKLYIRMRDTIVNEGNKQEILKQELLYSYEKEKALREKEHEKEIGISTERESKQKVISIAVTVGLFLVLLFAIFIFNRLRLSNRQKKEIEFQKQLVEHQKEIVDEKQKEIIDSINYAKRIQTALLASHELLRNNLPEYFVYFKPKDIVAGDFYWASPCPNGFLYITADCTGHGVPGAFMSLLNISKLNEAINQKHIYKPDLILNDVRSEIITALNPKGSAEESKDGMDAVLCLLDLKNNKLQYAAANNSFYIIRNREIINCKADKMPVGKSHGDEALFTFHEITIQKGDMIYTFTDGYADQFGGPKGKKYKYKQLEELLLANCHLSMEEQHDILNRSFEEWRGELEQVDDVCVIGIRV